MGAASWRRGPPSSVWSSVWGGLRRTGRIVSVSERSISISPVQGSDEPVDGGHLLRSEGVLPALVQPDLGGGREAHLITDDVVIDGAEVVKPVAGRQAGEGVDPPQRPV